MKSRSELVVKSVVLALALHGSAHAAASAGEASTGGAATAASAAAEAGASAEAAVPSAAAVTVAANTVAANEVANAAAETPADDQQLPASAQAEPTSDVEEVTVTGSRIAGRAGYEAPTPLTVISSAMLEQSANADLRDSLMDMPQFSGGYSLSYGAGVPSFNQAGIESIELRSLGGTRTLVLLDGQRAVGSIATGIVDVGAFPEQLIKRVEVVTGGASAVYGSDAVAGVVNFILDRDFTGTKVKLEGGETNYGDNRNYKLEISKGFGFADGRGHVLLSGEYYNNDGVVNGNGGREWARTATNYILNPANPTGAPGLPQYILGNNVFLAQGTHGGIINSANIGGKTYNSYPGITGVAFGQGGVPYNFNYGTYTRPGSVPGAPSDFFMAGGDYASTLTDTAFSLAPSEKRENIFGRVAYDVTENANVFVQVSRSVDSSYGIAFPQYQVGNSIKVLSGNPYIPAPIQAQMGPNDFFYLGSTNYDMGFVDTGTSRGTNRYVLGAEGKLDLFGSPWKWSAYAQIGTTSTDYHVYNARNNAHYTAALDAVTDPATGLTVCRSSLTNPGNGCIPWNPLGTGVNDLAAKNYILGTAHAVESTRQDVYSGSITGEPFSDWAGPVSLALNAEYRREKATVDSDPIAQVSGWSSGNLQPLGAQYHVKEAAVETLIPLLSKLPFADSWDLNAAFRATDYEVSGYVTTWKIGTTYSPIPDIKLRGTVSRDIRAPNISELFQAQNYGLISDYDPVTGQNTTHGRTQLGNPNLKPEVATNYTAGVVLQPSFMEGFNMSVDYWSVDIKDAISLIGASDVIVQCYNGRPDLCPWITRDPVTNVITTVQQGYFNLASEKAAGIDYEATYLLPLASLISSFPGHATFHVTGTRNIKNITNDGLTLPTDAAGSLSLPKTILNGSLTYELGQFSYNLGLRYFSSTSPNNNYIECTADCPASTTQKRTFDELTLASATYLDGSISYRLNDLFGGSGEGRLYLNVKNLTNKDPALTPAIGTSGLGYIYSRSRGGRWDQLGRQFLLGVEYKFK